jgi:ABC-type sugar transport system permease subunit
MLILTLIFVIYPIFGSIQMTMYNWSGIGTPTQYVGLRHFETVAGDQRFWNAFKNTIMYTVVLVPIQLTLALSLALILNNPRMRFRTFYKTIYFLPVVTSLSIVAIVVRLMLQSGGLYVSQALGINPPINPIGDAKYSMWAVIGFGTWYSFGINLVYFLAALQTVPEELYDAAKVDGANGLQRLLHVTLPSIRPVATIILFFAILGSLRVFEQSFVLTRGGPFFSSEVVAGYIYSYAFGGVGVTGQTANIGFASAAAFFMSLIVLGVTVIQIAVGRRVNKERV